MVASACHSLSSSNEVQSVATGISLAGCTPQLCFRWDHSAIGQGAARVRHQLL